MRLVLFDIDGTLLRTKGAGREATRRAMLEVFGTESTVATHEFSGKTDWRTLVELLGPHGITYDDVHARIMTYHDAMTRSVIAVFEEKYEVSPCVGATELVDAFSRRDDVVMGIVTGNVKGAAEAKLSAAGFSPALFRVGAFGHEAFDRDHLPPLAIQRASDLVGHSFKPQDIWVIGDTPMDIQCARAVGAMAVAVGTGFSPPEELKASQPDYYLDDLTQFSPHIAHPLGWEI